MFEIFEPEALTRSVEDCLSITRAIQYLHGVDHLDAMLCILVHLAASSQNLVHTSELSRRLGLPQQTVSNRVRQLHAKDLLSSIVSGRCRRLYPGPALSLRQRPPAA